MSNVLSDAKKNQVVTLGGLGRSLRHIEEKTGVRRETASAYLRAARIAVRSRGGRPREWPPNRPPRRACPPTLARQDRPPRRMCPPTPIQKRPLRRGCPPALCCRMASDPWPGAECERLRAVQGAESWRRWCARHVRQRGLPGVLSENELERLLAAVDLTSVVGRRDRAVLLPAGHYGLRPSDIRQLRSSGTRTSSRLRLRPDRPGNETARPVGGRHSFSRKAQPPSNWRPASSLG